MGDPFTDALITEQANESPAVTDPVDDATTDAPAVTEPVDEAAALITEQADAATDALFTEKADEAPAVTEPVDDAVIDPLFKEQAVEGTEPTDFVKDLEEAIENTIISGEDVATDATAGTVETDAL